MKILRNRFLPPKRYDAINLLGLLLCRPGLKITPELINHERIHTRQMLELAVVFYYLWYVVEWLVRLPLKGRAYRNLSFEREAYENMDNPDYLHTRRPYAWLRYLTTS